MNEDLINCAVCGNQDELDFNVKSRKRCSYCGTYLQLGSEKAAFQRSVSLVIAAYILYIPANIYPVMVIEKFGYPQPSTILSGIKELFQEGMYPIAIIVFVASIAIPLLKLIGITLLLVNVKYYQLLKTKHASALLFFIRLIGRWSMLDVLMVFFFEWVNSD